MKPSQTKQEQQIGIPDSGITLMPRAGTADQGMNLYIPTNRVKKNIYHVLGIDARDQNYTLN